MYDPDKSDFCYYPFFQVLVSADGKYKPCSKHGDFFATDKGRVLSAATDTFEKAWNSDYMTTMRDQFRKGQRPPGCYQCWKDQAGGNRSMRYDSYDYGIPIEQVKNPTSPMRVEINASNICNLKCRVCHSNASTQWINEEKEIYGSAEGTHINMTEENMEVVRRWVPNFTEIGFFGGEPLLAKQNLDLIRYCVKTGHSKHITILINTNGTVFTEEIAHLFKQFKKVFLNLSIDDIGPRFEYQRKNAVWDEVLENIKSYTQHGGYTWDDTIEIKTNCTLSNMNIYYMPEYMNFFGEHFPGLPVFWNFVYEPWAFTVQILPKDVKEVIKNRIKTEVKTTYEMSKGRTRTIDSLINYLNCHQDKDFQNFFKRIVRHDIYRNENFAATFPEFWELIKKYAPADLYEPAASR